MKYLIVLLIVCQSVAVYAANNDDIISECRPNAVYYNSYSNSHSRGTLMETYSGIDFPDTAEWDACEISVGLKLKRYTKKSDIKVEAVIRARLIDPDFSATDIPTYRRLNSAALDSDGQDIRAVLIYGYQKAQWVNTASGQDIDAYDPEADNGWP